MIFNFSTTGLIFSHSSRVQIQLDGKFRASDGKFIIVPQHNNLFIFASLERLEIL